MLRKDLHEENRLAWNVATEAHNSHKRDQAAFLREGGQTLFPEELELLGDIQGLSLVHLQCNAGQDTLSLAQRGAIVTGVDISDSAIDFARQLSEASGIPGTFVRSDIYDWLEETARSEQRFDIAFNSYGAIGWLSDINTWAKGVAGILKPSGRFVLVEFHPYAMIFNPDWEREYPYFGEGTIYTSEQGVQDYVERSGEGLTPSGYLEGVQNFVNPYRSHDFQWTITEVLSALLGAGLTLTTFKEYPYANGCQQFKNMVELPGRRMVPPEGTPNLPLMYGLNASK